MFKGLKKTAALALAAVLCISALAGCSKKQSEEKEAAAAAEAKALPMVTLGDESVSVGAFDFMLRYNMANDFISSIYRSMYQQDVDVWSYDMYGSGQIYGEQVKAELMHDVQHMMLEQAHMEEYGVSLTDDDKAAITKAAQAFLAENDEEVLENMNATQENVETMLTLKTIQSRMEAAMSADVDTVVSDEEAAQRIASYVSFTASTEAETEEETEELSEAAAAEDLEEAATEAETAVETVKEEAETAVAEAESEIKTQSAAEEATEEAAEDAAEEETETEDPAMAEAREKALADATAFLESVKDADADAFEAAAEAAAEGNGVSNGTWTFGADSTYPNAAIIAATEGLEDSTLVDHVISIEDTNYVVFVTDAFNEEATEERKDEIVEERKTARINELLEGWEGGGEAEASTEAAGEEASGDAGESLFTVNQEAFAALAFDYLLYQEEETELDLEELETEEIMSEEMTGSLQDATESVSAD